MIGRPVRERDVFVANQDGVDNLRRRATATLQRESCHLPHISVGTSNGRPDVVLERTFFDATSVTRSRQGVTAALAGVFFRCRQRERGVGG
jgi:hypothetical protein